MILEYSDNTYTVLPATLGIDRIKNAANYTPQRAPFSTAQVIAGDGLPLAEPFTIAGMAYFATTTEANNWIFTLKDKISTAVTLYIDGWLVYVHTADLAVVPTLLPRTVRVSIRVYPQSVIPFTMPTGLVHEYRYDDGVGSTSVKDYAGGADANIVVGVGSSPYWNQFALVFDGGGHLALPSSIGTTLTGDEWSQVHVFNMSMGVLVGRSTSSTPRSSGFIGKVSSELGVNVGGSDFNGIGGYLTGIETMYVGREDAGDLGVVRNAETDAGLNFSSSGTGTSYTDPAIGIGYFGGSTANRLVGTIYHSLFFNRSLTQAEREIVYRIVRIRLLVRGITI